MRTVTDGEEQFLFLHRAKNRAWHGKMLTRQWKIHNAVQICDDGGYIDDC